MSLSQEEAKEVLALLENLKEYAEVQKIKSTFLPALQDKTILRDDINWLHGSFRLGGTKSGRLSSASPNLQQIPSTGTKYAKQIKQCFAPPIGWLFVGSDYSSLEDRISALQTKDPNKLKPYLEGYDGHSLRAYAYFKEQMPDITEELKGAAEPEKVKIINSISERYPKLRQDSKLPTFALTYMGTYKTLMENGGFSRKEAKKIEEEYHRLYEVADGWVWRELLKASERGYVTLAFGLRLRTPILTQVLLESDSGLPWEAHGEIKTAGNALGQSYCLLNTRAANAFMEEVWNSKYAGDVMPVAQIHDAIYLVIRNDLNVLKWVNDHLIDCMTSYVPKELQHPEVGLEASLELYTPSWAKGYSIPNKLSKEELREHLTSLGLREPEALRKTILEIGKRLGKNQ